MKKLDKERVVMGFVTRTYPLGGNKDIYIGNTQMYLGDTEMYDGNIHMYDAKFLRNDTMFHRKFFVKKEER